MSRNHALGLAATVAVVVLAFTSAFPSGTPSQEKPTTRSSSPEAASPSGSSYDRGMELVRAERWADARKVFEDLADDDPENPDVLNMLAYTQRKTGDLDKAFENYAAALELRSKFPQAREYLAEAYLQAALREAATLRGYGEPGAAELRKLADAFQEAAASLQGGGSKDAKPASKW